MVARNVALPKQFNTTVGWCKTCMRGFRYSPGKADKATNAFKTCAWRPTNKPSSFARCSCKCLGNRSTVTFTLHAKECRRGLQKMVHLWRLRWCRIAWFPAFAAPRRHLSKLIAVWMSMVLAVVWRNFLPVAMDNRNTAAPSPKRRSSVGHLAVCPNRNPSPPFANRAGVTSVITRRTTWARTWWFCVMRLWRSSINVKLGGEPTLLLGVSQERSLRLQAWPSKALSVLYLCFFQGLLKID